MPMLTVNVKGSPVTFESPYDDTSALALLPTVRSDFAADLFRKRAQLSRLQLNWAHKLVCDALTPKPRPAGIEVSLVKVIEMFDLASAHLKFPRITLQVDGITLKLCRAGARSARQGS